MPGRDRAYQYQRENPEANKASNQSSGNTRADGVKDERQPGEDIMQRENMKHKGSNKEQRDDKIGTEPGPKKST